MIYKIIIFVIASISIASPAYGDGVTTSLQYKGFFAFISFVVVLLLAYFTTKFLSRKVNNFNQSKYINIIDHLNIDNNNKLAIVKVNNKTYIISLNNNSTTVIDEIENLDDTFLNKDNSIRNKIGFEKILSSILKKENNDNQDVKKQDVKSTLINSNLLSVKNKIESINKKKSNY